MANSPQPRQSDDDERKLLIGRVEGLLINLPAQEVRDDVIRAARKETKSRNNDWEEWDTESIQVLADALSSAAS